MQETNRYTTTAILLHWTIAILVLFLFWLGLNIDNFPREARPFWISIHATAGLCVLTLVILRFVWRLRHTPPPLPPGTSEIDRIGSHGVHILIYMLLVVGPLVGIVAFIWHARTLYLGIVDVSFGVPSTRGIFQPAEQIHKWIAFTIVGLAGVHALAALFHHYVLRDGLLRRMWPGRR